MRVFVLNWSPGTVEQVEQTAGRVAHREDQIHHYLREDGSVDEVHPRECPCSGCQLPITPAREQR
jgi:hypothetical protein